MAHVVVCPSFTQHFALPLADRLWGLGHSCEIVEYPTAPPSSYVAACEQAVAARLKAQVLRKPALLGYSFGGYFAACVAARWPELVESLVLVAAPGSLKAALANVAQDLGVPPAEAARRLLSEKTTVDPARLIAELRRMPASDEAAALAERIQASTLVIAGRRDRIVPLDVTLHSRIPRAELREVDDDHFLRRSIPSLADRVHEFLVAHA